MSNQLNKITKQYRKFKKGQAVEHTQFNEFLTYFEDQERLSRTQLRGVGVVCGFEATVVKEKIVSRLSKNGTQTFINITQGAGVTTDGDLVNLHTTSKKSTVLGLSDLKTIAFSDKKYAYYKAYDNYKVKYNHFIKKENNRPDKQIELWELATVEEAGTDYQTLDQFDSLDDKYVVFYVESYEKEVKPCRGVDCDNHGVQQIANVKVLLTNKEGIKNIANLDVIYQTKDVRDLYADLPEVNTKRIVLGEESNSVDEIRNLYTSAILENEVLENLEKGFDSITTQFGTPNSFNKEEQSKLLEGLISAPYGFQYAYGFIKELVATYNEIKGLLPKLNAICFPNVAAFPKHLLGGKLIEEKGEKFRHQFYGSPILDEAKIEDQVRLLIDRFNLQVRAFKNFNEIEKGSGDVKTGLRITPSHQIAPLGKKAIPFYYKLDATFLKKWNFTKTRNRISNTNLSYGATATIFANDRYVKEAIDFNLQNKSFYRIEGHQGKSYRNALIILNKKKEAHQLPFDIMALSLTELKSNKDLSKAYYGDYLEKHSGLQHQAGVKPGGTFVMVYESEESNTVFADFSLPYFCCGKLEKIAMSLPIDTICENDAPFPIIIEPLNGIVRAFVTVEEKKGKVKKELTGVITSQGNQSIFNPSMVSGSYHGLTITFTVNDQPTDIELTVYAQTEVAVAIADVEYDELKLYATVQFKVTAVNGSDLEAIATYNWDFGDNSPVSTEVPDANGIILHTYDLRVAKKEQFTPKLIVTNGNGCSTEVTIPKVVIEDSIRTYPCDIGKGFKHISNEVYSFFIDYKDTVGVAGITFNCDVNTVHAVSIEWNGNTVVKEIGTSTGGEMFFNKNMTTPNVAKVTITPKVRATAVCYMNFMCPTSKQSYPVQIAEGKCGEVILESAWKNVFMSHNTIPKNGDIVYQDNLLLIPHENKSKEEVYRMRPFNGVIYNPSFYISTANSNKGAITIVEDCSVPRALKITDVQSSIKPYCGSTGGKKQFKITGGTAKQVIKYQIVLSDVNATKDGGVVRINKDNLLLLNEPLANGETNVTKTPNITLDDFGNATVSLDVCANLNRRRTAINKVKAVFTLFEKDNTTLSDQIVEVEAQSIGVLTHPEF